MHANSPARAAQTDKEALDNLNQVNETARSFSRSEKSGRPILQLEFDSEGNRRAYFDTEPRKELLSIRKTGAEVVASVVHALLKLSGLAIDKTKFVYDFQKSLRESQHLQAAYFEAADLHTALEAGKGYSDLKGQLVRLLTKYAPTSVLERYDVVPALL